MIYVGTVHGDLKGYERMMRLIEHHNPGLITFEYPADRDVSECYEKIVSSGKLRNKGLSFFPRTNRTKLIRLMNLNSEFEGRIAGVCKQKGLDVRFVDLPGTLVERSKTKKRHEYDNLSEDEIIKRFNSLKERCYLEGVDEYYLEEMAKIMGYDQLEGVFCATEKLGKNSWLRR